MTVAKKLVAERSSHQIYQWFAVEILGRDDQGNQIDEVPCCLEIWDRGGADCSCCRGVRESDMAG